jgi:VanZ like family
MGIHIKTESPTTEPRDSSLLRWSWLIVGLFWCAFIAGTSSTVILPHDFFAWVASNVLPDQASFRRFVSFWRFSWFAIVKGWHAAEFAILFGFALAVLDRLTRARSLRNVALAVAFSLGFAMLDEYHQTFVPGRGGTWSDVAIDGLGTMGASLIAWRRRSR